MSFEVKLQYFRPGGKWYADGSYFSTEPQLFKIWEEVHTMLEERRLPGLIEGHSKSYHVLINVPEHPHSHPTLLVYRGTEEP